MSDKELLTEHLNRLLRELEGFTDDDKAAIRRTVETAWAKALQDDFEGADETLRGLGFGSAAFHMAFHRYQQMLSFAPAVCERWETWMDEKLRRLRSRT